MDIYSRLLSEDIFIKKYNIFRKIDSLEKENEYKKLSTKIESCKNTFLEKLKHYLKIDSDNYLIDNYWNLNNKNIKSYVYDNIFIDTEHYKLLNFCPSPLFINIRNTLNILQNKSKIVLISNYNLYLKIFQKLFIHEMLILDNYSYSNIDKYNIYGINYRTYDFKNNYINFSDKEFIIINLNISDINIDLIKSLFLGQKQIKYLQYKIIK